MKYRIRNYTKGFTIVELLIVIVVIGILVTIATATASSIQQRAVNTTYLATYKEVHKALLAKLVAYGYSTYTPAGEQFCIGKTTDFTSDGIGDCDSYQEDGAPQPSYDLTHQSATFDTAMAKVVPNMPGKLSQPFKLHISNEYGSGTTMMYNAVLHGYTDVPPAQDPDGEMRMTTGQKIAYLFGGPLYGVDQNCGTNSVAINNVFLEGSRVITQLITSPNEPSLTGDGMTYCLYAVEAP